MNEEATALWSRAWQTLHGAGCLIDVDPDGAASRSYYAAFHAVSAWFLLQGQTFSKHAAIEVAVHRDLVKAGLWPASLGAHYSKLRQRREAGDYGVTEHVTSADAAATLDAARILLRAVHALDEVAFPLPLDEKETP